MKKTLLTLGICVLGFTLVGCGQIPTLKDGKEVIASVKGKKISTEELYDKLKSTSGMTTLISIVDEFIANKEVETDEDAKTYAESQIESYKSSYKSYGQDFNEALKNAGYKDEDALKDALIIEYKKKTITENYVKGQITDAEIEKYYEEKIFGDIEAKHILVSVETDDDATDEEKQEAEKKAKEKAEKLIKKLNKGEDFEKLAKENSDDKGTASKGGKLTVKYGEVVDEFWEGCTKLKDKTYSKEPVKSEYGYHIILKVSSTPVEKFDKIIDDVKNSYAETQLASDSNLYNIKWDELRKKYKLEIKDELIEKAYNDSIKDLTKEEKTEKEEK